jgi:DNA polymerase III subunit beta
MFSAPASLLAEAAKAAARLIDGKSPYEILNNLLVTADGSAVAITGTNLHTWITATASAEVANPFSVAFPARLAKLLSTFPADAKVTIKSDGIVACGRSRFRHDILPADEFTSPPEIAAAAECSLDPRRLDSLTAIVDDDDQRPYVTGVYVADGVLCATDGKRLIEFSIAGTGIPGVILPKTVCEAIAKLDECTFRTDENLVEVRAGNLTITSKLIDGVFPAYKALIPSSSKSTVTVDRAELLTVMKRFATFLPKIKNAVPMVDLQWDDDELHLNLNRQADSASDSLPAETTGAGQLTGAIGLFVGFLQALDIDRVTFGVQANDMRARVTSPGDPSFIAMFCGARP